MNAATAILILVIAQQPAEPELLTPAQAVQRAAADLQTLPQHDWIFTRYIQLTDPKQGPTVALGLNLVANDSSAAIPAIPLGKPNKPEVYHAIVGGGWLLRINLRTLAPKAADFKRLHANWEELVQGEDREPYFHVYQPAQPKRVSVPPYVASDGKTYNFKLVETPQIRFAPHLLAGDPNQAAITALSVQTGSVVPIVRADWFMHTLLSQVDGGRYYQWAGIRRSNRKGETDEQAFLRSVGASREAVNPDFMQRSLLISKITGKWRVVEYFWGVGIRPTRGVPLVTITRDIKDGAVTPTNKQFVRNLLEHKWDASEAIVFKPNGHLKFAIFDGEGRLVDEVPPEIARDHTYPNGPGFFSGTARLQPAQSCMSCHKTKDGFLPAPNVMLKAREQGLTFLDDLRNSGSLTSEVYDTLRGQYGGNPDEPNGPFDKARDTVDRQVFKATLGLDVATAYGGLVSQVRQYKYGLLDARHALAELGIDLPAGITAQKAAGEFARVVPRFTNDQFGIAHEDPLIGFLRAGLEIKREDWNEIYADVAYRRRIANELGLVK